MNPESPRLLLRISLDHRIVAAADSLCHFQVSVFVRSSYTGRAPSTIDDTLPDYILVGVTKNILR